MVFVVWCWLLFFASPVTSLLAKYRAGASFDHPLFPSMVYGIDP